MRAFYYQVVLTNLEHGTLAEYAISSGQMLDSALREIVRKGLADAFLQRKAAAASSMRTKASGVRHAH